MPIIPDRSRNLNPHLTPTHTSFCARQAQKRYEVLHLLSRSAGKNIITPPISASLQQRTVPVFVCPGKIAKVSFFPSEGMNSLHDGASKPVFPKSSPRGIWDSSLIALHTATCLHFSIKVYPWVTQSLLLPPLKKKKSMQNTEDEKAKSKPAQEGGKDMTQVRVPRKWKRSKKEKKIEAL